jgi:hypothetical protein
MNESSNSNCRFFHILPTEGLKPLASREDALALLGGEGYLWLDYFDPTRESLESLIKPLERRSGSQD